ncbi:hypothetical protein FJV80_12325 [Mesorhizobium sp. WSM4310]|uniref:hypothetical protein n=1 Tax=Mesorhizobium sp. WSM4310 TaxID=2589883 RepID=UPI00115E0227|nr:hypothetical protein [Mesorhizobium sp. WSM4310]TRC87918.1 hypothetical protein FJV80_12325 [Mesorhizobium sp. WSM4310]
MISRCGSRRKCAGEARQGYYLGKPAPIEAFDDLTGHGKRTPARTDHRDGSLVLLKPSVRSA